MTKIWDRVCCVAILTIGCIVGGALGVATSNYAYIEGPGPMSIKSVASVENLPPMDIAEITYTAG